MKGKYSISTLLLSILISLTLASALYATDYAPDTLWSRQIEIEGFSYLEAKCSARTPDGGLLIGCDYYIQSIGTAAVFIKLNSDYEIEWFTPLTCMKFWFYRARIFVQDNNDYEILINQHLLRLSSDGDSLDTIDFGIYTRDVARTDDGEYIVVSQYDVAGFDSSLTEQWRMAYPGWNYVETIEKTPHGRFFIAGYHVDHDDYGHILDRCYLESGIIDRQGTLLIQNTSIYTECYCPKISVANRDSNYYIATTHEEWDAITFYRFVVDDIDCNRTSYIYGGIMTDFRSAQSRMIMGMPDGGALVFGMDMACRRTNPDGRTMWQHECDLDNDENDCYGDIADGAINAYLEEDGSILLFCTNNDCFIGTSIHLIKLAPELPKGIYVRGNNSYNVNNPVVNTSQNATWYGWGFEGNVNIELSRYFTNGPWEMLAENTPNDGNENLLYSPPEAEFCYLRISSVDDTLQTVSQWSFSVDPTRRALFFQEVSQPGIYLNSYDFGDIEYGIEQSLSMNVWRAHYEFTVPPILYSIRQQWSGPFSASGAAPASLENRTIEISIFPDFIGYTAGVIGFVTNAHQGDSLYYYRPGAFYPDSALSIFYVSANVVVTPESPTITLTRDNRDIIISWYPVTQSVGGINITGYPLRYFIFKGDSPDGVEFYLNTTIQTQLRDVWTLEYNSRRFYSVVAAIDTPALTQAAENWTGKSKSFVMNEINQLQHKPDPREGCQQ